MRSTRQRTVCPHCLTENDAVAPVSGDDDLLPSEGAVSLCQTCGRLSVFVVDGTDVSLRKPTSSEARELADDPYIIGIVTTWGRLHRRKTP